MKSLRTLAAACIFCLLALPAAAQLGLSPEGFEGLKVRTRPLNGTFKPEGGQGTDTALSGSVGGTTPIDGIAMRYFRAKLEYQVLVEGVGWQEWKKAGEEAGVPGKKIEGIRVRVPRGSIKYRVAQVGGEFTEWTKDGDAARVPAGKGIEAIEMEYLNIAKAGQGFEYRVAFRGQEFGPWIKDGSAVESDAKDAEVAAVEFRNGGGIRCEIALAGKGWRATIAEGGTCGDPLGRLRVEDVRLFSAVVPLRYRVKVDGAGWTKWYHDGAGCGTIGRNRRLLGIQVQPDPGE